MVAGPYAPGDAEGPDAISQMIYGAKHAHRVNDFHQKRIEHNRGRRGGMLRIEFAAADRLTEVVHLPKMKDDKRSDNKDGGDSLKGVADIASVGILTGIRQPTSKDPKSDQ